MALLQHVRHFAPWTILTLFGVLSACDRPTGPVRIGVAGAFGDSIGAPMRRAAELAAEEINAAGGIDGQELVLVFRDDYGNADSAVFVAEDLYASDVSAVVGHLFSNTTLAAAPVYNGGPTPLVVISPSSSSPEVTEAGDYTFRVCPSDEVHGAAMARWAYRRLGLRRGAILYVNDQYGRGVRRTFVQEFRRLGGELLSVDPYLGSTPEIGPYLERMTRDRPDFLLIAGNRSDAESILRQARRRGLNMPILGGDGLDDLEQAGAVAEGVYHSSAYFATIATPSNRDFLASYARRFPGSRIPNQAAAATYDAIHLLRDVITRAGREREAVRGALAAVGSAAPPFEGVTGTIAFDAHGDLANQNVHIGLIRDGRIVVQGAR